MATNLEITEGILRQEEDPVNEKGNGYSAGTHKAGFVCLKAGVRQGVRHFTTRQASPNERVASMARSKAIGQEYGLLLIGIRLACAAGLS